MQTNQIPYNFVRVTNRRKKHDAYILYDHGEKQEQIIFLPRNSYRIYDLNLLHYRKIFQNKAERLFIRFDGEDIVKPLKNYCRWK